MPANKEIMDYLEKIMEQNGEILETLEAILVNLMHDEEDY